MLATTQSIVEKSADGQPLTRADALSLLALPLHSDDCYLLMAAANRFSPQRAQSRGTIYCQERRYADDDGQSDSLDNPRFLCWLSVQARPWRLGARVAATQKSVST